MMKKIMLGCSLIFCLKVYAQHSKTSSTLTVFSKKSDKVELAAIKVANMKKAGTTQFQYIIIRNDNTGYGYSIYANGNLFIQQTTIPALSGNKGFSDRTNAEKCAQLVIQKLKQGEMPPAIRAYDLKKINTTL